MTLSTKQIADRLLDLESVDWGPDIEIQVAYIRFFGDGSGTLVVDTRVTEHESPMHQLLHTIYSTEYKFPFESFNLEAAFDKATSHRPTHPELN